MCPHGHFSAPSRPPSSVPRTSLGGELSSALSFPHVPPKPANPSCPTSRVHPKSVYLLLPCSKPAPPPTPPPTPHRRARKRHRSHDLEPPGGYQGVGSALTCSAWHLCSFPMAPAPTPGPPPGCAGISCPSPAQVPSCSPGRGPLPTPLSSCPSPVTPPAPLLCVTYFAAVITPEGALFLFHDCAAPPTPQPERVPQVGRGGGGGGGGPASSTVLPIKTDGDCDASSLGWCTPTGSPIVHGVHSRLPVGQPAPRNAWRHSSSHASLVEPSRP